MMFTLLQEQNKVHLKAMVASNKQKMDMMFKHMNALVAGHDKVAAKVTALPANNNTVRASGSSKPNKKKCICCGKHVFHKPEECY